LAGALFSFQRNDRNSENRMQLGEEHHIPGTTYW
jgi:hypothetical protein